MVGGPPEITLWREGTGEVLRRGGSAGRRAVAIRPGGWRGLEVRYVRQSETSGSVHWQEVLTPAVSEIMHVPCPCQHLPADNQAAAGF